MTYLLALLSMSAPAPCAPVSFQVHEESSSGTSVVDKRMAKIQECVSLIEACDIEFVFDPTSNGEWADKVGPKLFELSRSLAKYPSDILRASMVLVASPSEWGDMDDGLMLLAVANLVYEVRGKPSQLGAPAMFSYPRSLSDAEKNTVPAYWPWYFKDGKVSMVGSFAGYRGPAPYRFCTLLMDASSYDRRDLNLVYMKYAEAIGG